MRHTVRFLLLSVLFLAGQLELCASIPKTRVGIFFPLAASPCPEVALQVPQLRLDNPLPYGESVSGRLFGFVDGPNLYAYVRQNPWTAFDPEGLELSDHLPGWMSTGLTALPFSGAALLAAQANAVLQSGAVLKFERNNGSGMITSGMAAGAQYLGRMSGGLGVTEGLNKQEMTTDAHENLAMRSMGTGEAVLHTVLSTIQLVSTAVGVSDAALGVIRAPGVGSGVSVEPSAQETVRLQHGTTDARAASMVENGPNSMVDNEGETPGTSFTKPNAKATVDGTSGSDAQDYARAKAAMVGGKPAVVTVEVPKSIVAKAATQDPTEIRFEKGAGLEELQKDWAKLDKQWNNVPENK